DGYAELAAVGQVADEALKRADNVMQSIDQQLAIMDVKHASELRARLGALREELALLDSVQSQHGARRRTIDLQLELQRAGEAFAHRLEERGIRLDIAELNELVRLEMRPENLQRVL